MPTVKCHFPGCGQQAMYHVMAFQSRIFVSEEHYCDDHAPDHIRVKKGVGHHLGVPQMTGELIPFDIRYIVFTEKFIENQVWEGLFLEETNGNRKLSMGTGLCEATSIYYELRRPNEAKLARMMTHSSIVRLIRTLGGELQDIVVDEREQGGVFHSMLRIRQGDELVTVEMRPSDSFALAVAFEVPILVSEYVLATDSGSV